ncbi:MAG: hypothetical protein ABSF12_13880 [Bryobacteraceae bacterium]
MHKLRLGPQHRVQIDAPDRDKPDAAVPNPEHDGNSTTPTSLQWYGRKKAHGIEPLAATFAAMGPDQKKAGERILESAGTG